MNISNYIISFNLKILESDWFKDNPFGQYVSGSIE